MQVTDQSLFDHVAKHLLTQNAKARDPRYGSCRYRVTDSPLRCAIGSLIHDEFYTTNLEGRAITINNAVRIAVEKSIGQTLTPPQMMMLSQLQVVHDYNEVEEWPTKLANFAERTGLKMVEIPLTGA